MIMLAWIKRNKEWLFSGVAIAILVPLISHFWPNGGEPPPPQPDNSRQQRHSGTGDIVGRDKNVTVDNSQHQRHSGTGDNIGRDKIIKQYLLGSVDYKELLQEIKDAKELLAGIAPEKTALRLKQSAKVEELQQRLEDFKENVFRLHELFTRIPLDNERLRKAKAHFDKGEFREADAVLKAEEIQEDVERLKLEEQAAKERLSAVRKGLEDRANEYLLKAQLSLLNPVAEGEDRFSRTEQWFKQALATARTVEVLFEYAKFLYKQNVFSRAKPLYEEALTEYRNKAAADPKAFLPDVATTLNNLAILHSKTGEYSLALKEYQEALKLYSRLAADQPKAFLPYVANILNNMGLLHSDTGEYSPALKEYEEALKIKRELAAKEPGAFSQDLVKTLLSLSIFYLQAVPDKAKSVAYAQEAREILKTLIPQAPHLQGHLDHAERLLEDNKTQPDA
ncbi:MAG: hypothetical protein D3911_04875 [Candidatus Electrothrix sp. AW3_4]|nr:hypothetical protein [Candidatus Electrothrix gigas]